MSGFTNGNKKLTPVESNQVEIHTMTQTNHSNLLNDMDRTTHELVRLMTSVGRMSLDRTSLQENIATLTQENFRLQCDIAGMRQCALDDKELYEQIINEKNLTLAEEEKYADNLHDSLSDMKMLLNQTTESLAKEKVRYEALQEEKRKESEQLRADLEAMYRLRDEMKAERDEMKAERDEARENYRAACVELRDEYEAHTTSISEYNQVLASMGISAEKFNRRCVDSNCDDDRADSIS